MKRTKSETKWRSDIWLASNGLCVPIRDTEDSDRVALINLPAALLSATFSTPTHPGDQEGWRRRRIYEPVTQSLALYSFC